VNKRVTIGAAWAIAGVICALNAFLLFQTLAV